MKKQKNLDNVGALLSIPLLVILTFGSLHIMNKIGDKIGFTMLVLPIVPILIGNIICKLDKKNNNILNAVTISLWMAATFTELVAIASIFGNISNIIFGNAIIGLLILLVLILALAGKKDTQK